MGRAHPGSNSTSGDGGTWALGCREASVLAAGGGAPPQVLPGDHQRQRKLAAAGHGEGLFRQTVSPGEEADGRLA